MPGMMVLFPVGTIRRTESSDPCAVSLNGAAGRLAQLDWQTPPELRSPARQGQLQLGIDAILVLEVEADAVVGDGLLILGRKIVSTLPQLTRLQW